MDDGDFDDGDGDIDDGDIDDSDFDDDDGHSCDDNGDFDWAFHLSLSVDRTKQELVSRVHIDAAFTTT